MSVSANDFSKGKVWKNIILQAVPLILAQMVQLLYNIVDRIYIGHLPDTDGLALTGVGLTFPVITLIAAFTSLFGMGGTPLFSIARGAKNEEEAQRIQGNVFLLLFGCGVILLVLCQIFLKPVMYLFGASGASYPYAAQYLRIYLLGTVFSMLSTGMNGFINAQGFPKIGMMTTMIGALLNLILDPLFIFVLDLGVGGAAFATIISQAVSAVWVIRFLRGKKAVVRLTTASVRVDWKMTREIVGLGASGFIVQATNCLVQIVCNATLQVYGGDLYVGIMTVLNSVRELLSLPVHGITSGSQPVLGYNYGAGEYKRVRAGIRFSSLIGIGYTIAAWLVVLAIPTWLIGLFANNQEMLVPGARALNIYFFGFCFMAFQFAGQSVFQALGYAKQAIFFSLLRKVVIVVPLTIILPMMGFGVDGVFLAEPISNFIGGLASFLTMYFTVYRKFERYPDKKSGVSS